jgi:hypothetical protein
MRARGVLAKDRVGRSSGREGKKGVREMQEAAPGFEPGSRGFADLCLTTWLCRPSGGHLLPGDVHYHNEARI